MDRAASASGAMRFSSRRKTRPSGVVLLCVFLCVFHLADADAEIYDCKTKVRNEWIKYCISGYEVRAKRQVPEVPADPQFRFVSPVSGDDLGFGLSDEDMNQLFEDLAARSPRAARNKQQFVKMMNGLAARCCSDNLRRDCIASDNMINCP
ncbi:uncharacterized protein LOC107219340 [Neodiprion lecontei]|uniref:Uncharacterized protein LOC107219340 n=1 Tax=Neodiprion lecontei TaxID=441921 RepID=A0A6J0BH06_NEOLC|nr:uncharacterized protein LOC107219340 [Neodiprion lecontei]